MSKIITKEDLRKWFKEDWVDISRKNKDGSHPECGASSNKGKRKKDKQAAYPKCLPKKKAKTMSSKDKKSASKRKRNAERKKGSKNKNTFVKTKKESENYEDKLIDKKKLLFDDMVNEYMKIYDEPSEETMTFFFDKKNAGNVPVSDFYKSTAESYWGANRKKYLSGEMGVPKCMKSHYDSIAEKEIDKYKKFGIHGYDNEYIEDIGFDENNEVSDVILKDGVYPIDLEEQKIFEAVHGKEVLREAVYKGKDVKLNKPKRGGSKKFYVYVNSGKKTKDGKVKAKKVSFGSPSMSIKRDSPERRKSFRARHKCDTAKDNKTARYWSCRFWSKKSVSDLLK